MSKRDYEAEARDIATFLGVEFEPYGENSVGWFIIGDAAFNKSSSLWAALLRLARQPRSLPAVVPEGHERIRVALWRDKWGFSAASVLAPDSGPVCSTAYAIARIDVPLPKPVEIVGSVES